MTQEYGLTKEQWEAFNAALYTKTTGRTAWSPTHLARKQGRCVRCQLSRQVCQCKLVLHLKGIDSRKPFHRPQCECWSRSQWRRIEYAKEPPCPHTTPPNHSTHGCICPRCLLARVDT